MKIILCFEIKKLFQTDEDFDVLEKKLAVLKKQKHGLMQKLLTGEIRVTIEN